MSRFKTVALTFSAVLLSVTVAQAATHKKPVHHTAAAAKHGKATTAASTSPDRSADSLNAQSLARSQAPTQ